jgi:DegV family protein with EDD domain
MSQTRKVGVVTDSTSDISHELAAQHGITIVPLNLHFGDEVFKDQVNITTDQFMEKMSTSDKLPTTSQPSVGSFENAFRDLAADGATEIVCPVISSRLSGTYQSAQIAAQNLAGEIRVEVVDSLSGSWGLGFQVMRAVDLASQGWDAARIASTMANETVNYHVVFFVETLEHLHRGGRITKAAQLVGSALKLRPLLRVDEGAVVPFERTRTRGKAMQALVDYAASVEGVEELAVIHNTTPDDAGKLAEMLASITPDRDIRITQMGPVLDTHLGAGAMGVVTKVAPIE